MTRIMISELKVSAAVAFIGFLVAATVMLLQSPLEWLWNLGIQTAALGIIGLLLFSVWCLIEIIKD